MLLLFACHHWARWGFILVLSVILIFTAVGWGSPSVPLVYGPLPQQTYIWQRSWTKEVCNAASSHGGSFNRMVVLKTEVSWSAGRAQVAQVALDYPTLLASRHPTGLALRIGSPGGRIFEDAAASSLLVELAFSAVREARQKGLEPAELQIDFDCPESQLDDYARWIVVVRQRLAPVPVTITVLPCWLDHSVFAEMARVAPDYVLQVHSLECPTKANAVKPLCDPGRARAWVAKAARFGVPFRVALPTCSYRLAFDHVSRRFAGLMAEGPARHWPETIETRVLSPEPDAMAGLVREWTESRPRNLCGLIWYRLPAAGDNLNWSWPTLSAVMQGRSPKAQVETEIVQSGDGLFEVYLANRGEAEPEGDLRVKIEWDCRELQDGSRATGRATGRLLASEALDTFEPVTETSCRLVWKGPCRLKPGERKTVGWVRLVSESEVRAHVALESP